MPVGAASWSFTEDDFGAIQKSLQQFLYDSNARCALLVDRSGQCLCAVPRRRLEVRGGEVSKAVTVRSETLIDLAFGMVKALPGAYGVLNFQVFAEEETGKLAVIEINPRFGGGFPLTHRAGADYARWLLEDLQGLPSTASADGWRDGLVMLRYDAAVFVDQTQAPG